MKSDVLLLTRNLRIAKELKHLSNANVHTIGIPMQINKVFKKKGKHLEVALLDLTFPEQDLNRFIFYIKQYKKDMPVLLLSAEHTLSIESEAMRNLAVYGYVRHPERVEEIEEILGDLNKLFQLDMDKKLERVDYLEGERVYACTFKDMKKYFLKRDDVLDNVNEEITKIAVEKAGHHFTVRYATGERSIVPWDFVKSICEDKYQYYNYKSSTNISSLDIGQKVKKYRQSLKLTQEGLERKTGIKRANIARIETGKHMPSLETLENIANAVNIPVVNFLVH